MKRIMSARAVISGRIISMKTGLAALSARISFLRLIKMPAFGFSILAINTGRQKSALSCRQSRRG